MMADRSRRGRRWLTRRRRYAAPADPAADGAVHDGGDAVGADLWDTTVEPPSEPAAPGAGSSQGAPLLARALALFGDPRVDGLTPHAAARMLAVPREEAEVALEALVVRGRLLREGPAEGGRYVAPPEIKARLEAMFRETAVEVGRPGVLARTDDRRELAELEDDEPRLPITAGLLSLFLPGTGQLLNGDVGRASLVFAVWSLAWITHLSPIWSFVCLYAGAEAFFTAKIRSMERRLAREAASRARAHGAPTPALPPKPT